MTSVQRKKYIEERVRPIAEALYDKNFRLVDDLLIFILKDIMERHHYPPQSFTGDAEVDYELLRFLQFEFEDYYLKLFNLPLDYFKSSNTDDYNLSYIPSGNNLFNSNLKNPELLY